jgi:hypothetical protein
MLQTPHNCLVEGPMSLETSAQSPCWRTNPYSMTCIEGLKCLGCTKHGPTTTCEELY